MAREDGASTVHGADCENDALSLKTQPCPPVCPASCPSVPVASRHSVPPVSCPPVPMPPPIQMSSPDEAMQNSLGLNYEPVPLRLQSPEEQRVRELLQRLVQCDGSLAPLMDVWGKSTVDVLLDICPNSPLFAELSQEQRESSLQDHWSQGPSGVNSEHDLISQKVELCEALRSCIESLEQEKEELSDAIRAHMELGRQVEAWVQEHCEAAHRTKYVMFIGDLERVVNLLLSLCGRLARVERSLASLRRQEPAEDSTELWDSLLHKQSILLRQTQDALELRDHLERRQCIVHEFLCYSLEPSQLQQYQRLVSSTPALVITHRRLDEMLQQTQEQLSLLLDTLPLEVTQARGWSRVGLALSATPLLKISQVPPK
ncbi:protein Shroom2-like [Periophthalmus magnuspinnatus]|uniref:protein Shroom2-like n=1 Tax=Periophthalmus magnuspinnatus TaxID=409849 RepID=UPI0024366448|nr:protein Shroom2-like [Periophthalmus magnuspinnatus]